MSKLFISYSVSDTEFVEDELKGLLEALGFQVWYAEANIQTAEDWERTILKNLQSSEWFVLVMTPRSSKSEWVKDEISWAIKERPERIIPIMLQTCDPMDFHMRLSRIQYIDFRDNKKEAVENLIRLLVDTEYKPNLRKVDLYNPLVKKSRNFWNPFAGSRLQIVVGRFTQFRDFEQSGFLGVGDAVAMTELQRHFEMIGLKDVAISYADRLDGDALNTNLVLLGGADANSITREMIRQINPTIKFGDPDIHQISFYDSELKKYYFPEKNGSNDYGIIYKTANPFYPDKQFLLCAGSFGFGTWAGVRFIMSETFLNQAPVIENKPIECLVETKIFRETPQSIQLVLIRELKFPE